MDWIQLFPEQEIQEGARKLVKASTRRMFVLRFKGKLYAIESTCPHMRFSLQDGRITEDGGIICPFHHSAFDLETGDVKEWAPWPPSDSGPMIGSVVREHALVTFPVKTADGFIWVSPRPQNV